MPPTTNFAQAFEAQSSDHLSTDVRTRSRFDSIAQKVLIVLFGLLPFFFLPVTWMSALQSKIVLSSIALLVVAVLWAVARVFEGGGRVPKNLIIATTAFLPIAYALSTVVNGFSMVSIVGVGVESDTLAMVALGFSALTLTAALFAAQSGRIAEMVRAFFAGILVLQIIHLFHVAMPSMTLGGVLAGETGNAFGTWHEFTILIGLGLVAGLALMRSSIAVGPWAWIMRAVVVLSLPILFVGNFADVWWAIAASAVVLFLVQWYQTRMPLSIGSFKTSWALAAITLVSVGLALYGAPLVSRLPDRINVVQVEVRPSWQGTYQVGELSLTSTKSRIFGVGPNTFARQWGLYKPLEVNQTPFWNADFNVGFAPIPTSLISLGIIGALAWFGFIAVVLARTIRLWISRSEEALSPALLALSVSVAYLLAFHLFSVPGSTLSILMFFMIGLLIASYTKASSPMREFTLAGGDARNAARIAASAVVVVVTVLSSVLLLRAIVSDILINRAVVVYNATQDLEKATSYINLSLSITPNNDRAHRSAVELGLLRIQSIIAANDPTQEDVRTQLQATLEETIRAGLSAVEANSRDYQNWLQLAALYSQLAGAQISGAYDNARAAYLKAQEENPTSPLPLLNLGQLDAIQGNYDAALENLAKAVALKPDLASAYYIASQVYVAKNDPTNALQAAALAARFAPNDPLAWYNAGAIAYAAGAWQDAGYAMQQALAIQPQYANAMYVLGLSLYQLADYQNSLIVFQALDQLDPNQPAVKEAITTVQAALNSAQAASTPTTEDAE